MRVGDHNIELDFRSGDKSEWYGVAKLTMHPKYRPPRSYHDIAVITLRRGLTFSRFVRPICLPPPDHRLRRGMTAKITGHGYQEFSKYLPTVDDGAERMEWPGEGGGGGVMLGCLGFAPKGYESRREELF